MESHSQSLRTGGKRSPSQWVSAPGKLAMATLPPVQVSQRRFWPSGTGWAPLKKRGQGPAETRRLTQVHPLPGGSSVAPSTATISAETRGGKSREEPAGSLCAFWHLPQEVALLHFHQRTPPRGAVEKVKAPSKSEPCKQTYLRATLTEFTSLELLLWCEVPAGDPME